MNWQTHKDILFEAEQVLEENKNSSAELSKKNQTVENRKQKIETKEHSNRISKILNQFEEHKADLIRKIQILKKLELQISDSDTAEIFRNLVHITYNNTLYSSSINFVNRFSGKKEDYPIAVYKNYEPKINFNIGFTEEEMETVRQAFNVDEKQRDSPEIFLFGKSAGSLPQKIKNERIYPMIIDEIFRIEKYSNETFEGKEHLFHIASFDLGIA